MRLTLALLVVLAAACGIKAPPRPPLEVAAPDPIEATRDGGCCGARP
jgi:predicted small lipoprotein YifL